MVKHIVFFKLSAQSAGSRRLHNKSNLHALLSEGRFPWIGERVCVLKSACKDVQGLEGLVLDESKNSVVLQTLNGKKRVPKKNTLFFFLLQKVVLEGSRYIRSPVDRLKD